MFSPLQALTVRSFISSFYIHVLAALHLTHLGWAAAVFRQGCEAYCRKRVPRKEQKVPLDLGAVYMRNFHT